MARGSIVKRCPICRKNGFKCAPGACSNKNVIYYAVYRVNGKQKWEAAGSSKKEAEKLLAKRQHELNSKAYFEPKDIKFKQFSLIWLNNCPKSRVKYTTFRGYETNVNKHLNPVYGEYKLSLIKKEAIEGYLAKLTDTLDPRTVNDIRLTLYMIMEYAKSLKYIMYNPVKDIKPYKIEQKEMRFLNPTEIRLLIEHSIEPYRTLFLTAIFTGMRRGELLALKWCDIDWDKNLIFVRRGIYWHSQREGATGKRIWSFTTPKSKRSIRSIIMSATLKEALRTHRQFTPLNEHDFVFIKSNGDLIQPEYMVKKQFKTTLRRAGIKKIRFHDTRHTHVALLINQGENPKFIQRQLGHASIKTTLDRYGHLFPLDHEAIGSRLDNQVFGLSNNCLTRLDEKPVNSMYQGGVLI